MAKYVVVGPGAMAFYSLLGSLHANVNYGNLKEISGSSAGALASLCFLLDVPVKKCLEVDVKNIIHPSIKTFLNDYGFVSRRKVFNYFKEFFEGDFTFKELYERTGKVLHIAASSVTYKKVFYFSVKTSPNISVLDTLVTSISVPFLFVPSDDMMVDGSVYEKIPGGPFVGKSSDDILEISLTDARCSNEKGKRKNVLGFFFQMIQALLWLRHTYEFQNRKTIPFDMDDCYDFGMSQEKKLECYKRGFAS